MKAICIGHATYDTTLPMEFYPKENNKYRINREVQCGGGPAATAAYLLAKWQVDTTFVGEIGTDFYAECIEEEFKQVGVNTTYLIHSNQITTSNSYVIANTKTGSRTVINVRGENSNDLHIKENLTGNIILADGDHVETALEIIKNNQQAISILDAGTLKDATITLGKVVDYLVCSKKFAEDFAKERIDFNKPNTLKEVYDKLEIYFKTKIIVTLEAVGCLVKLNNKYVIIPSIKVEAVDSTGAGDIFHGAFAYFISHNYSLEQAIFLSNITSALSVLKVGTRNSIPSIKEVLDIGRKRSVTK